jgi:hypothetical protein
MSQRWKTLENEVAKSLSSWLFGDPKILRRSPCSGGWKGRGSDGDIIVADDKREFEADYPFCTEVKCRVGTGETGWHFEQLLSSDKHPILSWWFTLTEARPVSEKGKMRLLVFSKKSGLASAYVAIGDREYKFMESAGQSLRCLPKVIFSVGRSEDPSVSSETLYFFYFREFVGYIDAVRLKSLWRSLNVSGNGKNQVVGPEESR